MRVLQAMSDERLVAFLPQRLQCGVGTEQPRGSAGTLDCALQVRLALHVFLKIEKFSGSCSRCFIEARSFTMTRLEV